MRFVHYILSSDNFRDQVMQKSGGTSGSMSNISKKNYLSMEIPLPPLETQREIVEKIEAERELVESATTLATPYEERKNETLAKLWQK